MKLKKLISALIGASVTLSAIVVPVSAASYNFHIYHYGGAVVSTNSEQKTNSLGYMHTSVYERPGTSVTWVYGAEGVYLRGRTASGAKCTNPVLTYSPGEVFLTYDAGNGISGHYYKLAMQYADANPYTHLDLTGTWTP